MIDHLIAYEGVRVSLGLVLKEYGPDFVRLANRRGHIDGVRLRPPYTLKDFEAWHERILAGKGSNEVFAVLVHEDTEAGRVYRYVGHTGIHDITFPEAHATSGTVIADPDAQGKGYGKEAKLLLQQHAFHTVGLRTLRSAVKEFNAASVGHLIACGYRICGRYHGGELHKGRPIDAILFECFREDWEPLWEAYRATGTVPVLSDEQRALVQKETNL